MQNESTLTNRFRPGNWLPSNQEQLDLWLTGVIKEAEKKKAPLHRSVENLKKLIESDPAIYMYFTQMFLQIPRHGQMPKGSGVRKILSYEHMLTIINHVLTTPPDYNETGMVGFPINAILDWPMGTEAGSAAFLNDKVNAAFREIINAWGRFLTSKESLSVFNKTDKGWMCKSAQKAINIDWYQHDPGKPHWGFKSWNDFFIREFKPGMRPVAEPDNDKVIVSACESTPFQISKDVQKRDTFWIKSQPYSLEHMLAGNDSDKFIGGTVYQAYLSAKNYHRWHSPVSGTIKKKILIPGTYYSEALSEGFDPAGPNNSQGYISHVATRALIFIESNNPAIGLMCVIPVGMAEVSSCKITVREGQKVKKGQQLGYFQFGGSTHCLIFKKVAIAEFSLNAIPAETSNQNPPIVNVNSKIATSN